MRLSTIPQALSLCLSLGIIVEGKSISRNDACQPNQPFNPLPASQIRYKTCHVANYGNGRDDSSNIMSALKKCNNGGKVVFDAGKTYTIGKALDMTFLKHVDLGMFFFSGKDDLHPTNQSSSTEIQGTIQFTNDTDYWQANAFKQGFQNATTFFQLGGEDVNMYGDGMLDGNGQVWYDLYAQDALILRPILVGIIGLHGGTIGPLKLRYSPQWYHLVANSSNVLFEGIDITGYSKSKNTAKNTDGW